MIIFLRAWKNLFQLFGPILPWRLRQVVARWYVDLLRSHYDRVVDDTPPCLTGMDSPHFEVHLLLGTRHVGMCLWAVKSLLVVCGKPYSVVLHDDGSLTDADVAKLEQHLPGVRVFRKSEADSLIVGKIAGHPLVERYRFNRLGETDWGRRLGVFALKLLDFNLLTDAKKILVLDTDVLFFKKPKEILAWIEDEQCRNTLYGLEYYKPKLDVRHRLVGFERKTEEPVGFNSGLICLQRDVIDLSALEAWMESNKQRVDTTYTFEQHAYNHLVDRSDRHRALPDTYSFNYNDPDCIATHFGAKPLFFENLPRIQRLLADR